MPFVIIEDAHGKRVQVEVSEAVAIYIAEDDRYIASLHDNDQRYFQLVHFDKPAWENVRGLSAGYSAEDESLDVPEEIAEAEQVFYRNVLLCAAVCFPWCAKPAHRPNGGAFYSTAIMAKLRGKLQNWKNVTKELCGSL